ncbi:MAG: flagellum-specific ATP synthase FliI, partial [Pseudogulbenkiania sp.]|nr:flagellum-specific ATP synthase FliI [Pseudogulbenkiania sp.]
MTHALLERQRRFLADCRAVADRTPLWQTCGKLVRVTGMVMEAVGLKLPVGSACAVSLPDGHAVEAEVVGFAGDKVFLMPLTNVQGLLPGAEVRPLVARHCPAFGQAAVPVGLSGAAGRQVPVGFNLLGRVLDSLGRPLDEKGTLQPEAYFPLYSQPLNPLERSPVRNVLDVGVRAINGLLTVGRGQRLGLFAGSGVGKSVLLGMMARFTKADIVVVGLIGERGREVKDFIENILGEEGRARSVIVAAPADTPPLMRLHGAA